MLIIAAYALTVQSLGLSLYAFEPASSCCCAHAKQRCQCKVCTHARELEAGAPVLKTCAAQADAITVIALAPALPPEDAAAMPSPRWPPLTALPAPPGSPLVEIPTPPPLARS